MINLGFEFILYEPINKKWKYYYFSNSSIFFDKAFEVNKRGDMKRLMRHIVSLDLSTNYCLKKQFSPTVYFFLSSLQLNRH